jgi:hypothetical protein
MPLQRMEQLLLTPLNRPGTMPDANIGAERPSKWTGKAD